MKLSQLVSLVLINQYTSITKAAQKSFISQSALSVSIRDLEEELGNIILIRNQKGVEFTQYGLTVLEHVKNILTEVDIIKKLSNNRCLNIYTNMSFGVSSYFCNIIAMNLIISLKDTFPQIKLSIHQDKNTNIIEEVLSGTFNFGLLQIGTSENRLFFPQKFLKNKFKFNILFTRPIKIAVSGNHPLYKKKNLCISDLFNYPYVTSKNLDEDVVYHALKSKGFNNDVIQINETVTRNIATTMNGFFVGADTGITEGNKHYHQKAYLLDINNFSSHYTIGWIHKNNKLCDAEEKVLTILRQQTELY